MRRANFLQKVVSFAFRCQRAEQVPRKDIETRPGIVFQLETIGSYPSPPFCESCLGKGATPGTTAPLPCATEYKAVSWHHWNRPPRRLRCPHGEELLAAPGVSGATASDPPRGLLRRQTRLSLHASTARTTLRHHGGSPPHSALPTFVPRRPPGLSFKPKPVTAFT